jgi:hypothetical protein
MLWTLNPTFLSNRLPLLSSLLLFSLLPLLTPPPPPLPLPHTSPPFLCPQLGEYEIRGNCSEECTCETMLSELTCRPLTCHDQATCRSEDGVLDCYCDEGFKGDGRICNGMISNLLLWRSRELYRTETYIANHHFFEMEVSARVRPLYPIVAI